MALDLVGLCPGALYGFRHCNPVVLPTLGGMAFQVGLGDGLATGGDVVLDAPQGFLVQALGLLGLAICGS